EGLKGRTDALYVVPDGLVNTNRIRINTLALGAGLPTTHALREYAESAGLMSYGPNVPDGFRRVPILLTRFFAERSRAIFRSSSRPSSILSSISRPLKRSASTCHRRCSPAPTR